LPFLPSKTPSTREIASGPVTRITAIAEIPPPVARAEIVEKELGVRREELVESRK